MTEQKNKNRKKSPEKKINSPKAGQGLQHRKNRALTKKEMSVNPPKAGNEQACKKKKNALYRKRASKTKSRNEPSKGWASLQ